MICKKCNVSESRTIKAHYCEECFITVRKKTHQKTHFKNKEKRNKISSEYKETNKDKISEYNKTYNIINKDILSLKRKEKREYNKDKLNLDSRIWRINNKDKVLEYNRINIPLYNKKYPWRKAIRTLLYNTIKRIGGKKENKTVDVLGYSAEELKIHIELLFTDGMSWDNYGEWHIDHKVPVCSFEKEVNINIINALSNLQPLWKFDNLSKGKKPYYIINI